jgi:hypothetical protein
LEAVICRNQGQGRYLISTCYLLADLPKALDTDLMRVYLKFEHEEFSPDVIEAQSNKMYLHLPSSWAKRRPARGHPEYLTDLNSFYAIQRLE